MEMAILIFKNHLFFLMLFLDIYFDFLSQKIICFLAASSLNFLPQNWHEVRSYKGIFIKLSSYFVKGLFLPSFMPALNAALSNFHFGNPLLAF
jgi:hypothetical protein